MFRLVIWVANKGMGFGPVGVALAVGSLVLTGVGIGRKTKRK